MKCTVHYVLMRIIGKFVILKLHCLRQLLVALFANNAAIACEDNVILCTTGDETKSPTNVRYFDKWGVSIPSRRRSIQRHESKNNFRLILKVILLINCGESESLFCGHRAKNEFLQHIKEVKSLHRWNIFSSLFVNFHVYFNFWMWQVVKQNAFNAATVFD